MTNNTQTINISTSTIFRIILILLGIVFLYIIRDVLIMVFVAVIISAAVNGPAAWLEKRRLPRALAVILIYLLIFFILGLIIFLVLPPLISESKNLADVLPKYIGKTGLILQEWWTQYKGETGNLQNILGKAGEKLTQVVSSIFTTTIGVFGGLVSALVILVISFYLSIQEKGIKKFLIYFTPAEHQRYVSDLTDRIQIKVGSWLRGQLLVALIVGILTYLGLFFLGIKYALVLGLIMTILELVPYLGPILAAIPAVILAFFQAPYLALLVLILYVVIQQIENNVIVPFIMRRAVGLSPIIIIIVMLIGVKLAGILGLILAVPIAAATAEFLKDMRKKY